MFSRVVSVFFVTLLRVVCADERHKALLHELFVSRDYIKDVRPVKNSSWTTVVGVFFDLHEIVEVNTREQYVRLWTTIKQQWEDDFLTWNPEDYGGLDELMVDKDLVWQPDTYMYNNMLMDVDDSENTDMIALSSFYYNFTDYQAHSTRVFKRTLAIYTASCEVKVRHFPFDVQSCNISLASWTQPISQIDYYFIEKELDVAPNVEWRVMSINLYRTVEEATIVPPFGKPINHTYSQLHFEIIYARRPVFYSFALVIPAVIVMLATYLGIFSMSDSTAERGEKFTLGVSSILALSIMLLVVGDLMPRSSNPVPYITVFIMSQMFLMATALLISTMLIQLQIYGTSGPPVPKWLRCCLDKKPKPEPEKKDNKKEKITLSHEAIQNISGGGLDSSLWRISECTQKVVSKLSLAIKETIDDLKQEQKIDDSARDWINLVSNLERFLGVLFIVILAVSTVLYMALSLGPYVTTLEKYCYRNPTSVPIWLQDYCSSQDISSKIMRLMAKIIG